MERSAWQQPVDAEAISERGRQAAAEERAKQLLEAIRGRGCREEFAVNAALLPEGRVDFLPVRDLTAEELAAQAAEAAKRALQVRRAVALVDGAEKPFTVNYKLMFKTNGGHMADVEVTFEDRATQHRVIIGKEVSN